MSVTTPTSQVREWIAGQIEGQTTVRLPDLADAAVEYFSTDELFVRAFLSTHLRPIIYDLAQKVMASTRGRENVIVGEDTIFTREGFNEKAKQLQSKWDRWLEHVGDRHLRLTAMTRGDLLLAAERREMRANSDLDIAKLFRALAERMEDDQTVGELFTAEQIEKVRLSLEEREAA